MNLTLLQMSEENHPSPTDNATSQQGTTEPQTKQRLIIGIFADVWLLNGTIIRKTPRKNDVNNPEAMLPIYREALIYNILGPHPRIAECLTLNQHKDNIKHIDIKYYPHSDLTSYCKKHSISPTLRSKWFRQILESIILIHSFGVIHSDLALRQFLVDNNFDLRLGDFNSSQCPDNPALGYEKASHCLPRDYELPNTEASDIFALGSTLYELVCGNAPYSELNPVPESNDPEAIRAHVRRQHAVIDYVIEERYKAREFADVSGVWNGHIILGCWKGEFATAKEVLDTFLES